MEENKSKDIWITLTTILLIVLIGTVVFFWQNYKRLKSSNTEPQVQKLVEEEKPVDNNVAGTIAPSPATASPDTPNPTPSEENKTEVIFVSNGLFTEEEKVELYEKLIEPFLDFQKDSNIQTLTLEIEKSSLQNAGYKYKVSYINKGGSKGGLLFGLNTPLEWWLPECLNGCSFSDSFKEKYPEIVEQLD